MKTLDSKGPIVLDFTRRTDGYFVYEGLQYGRKVTIYFPDRGRVPAHAIQAIVRITAYDERANEPTRDEGAAVEQSENQHTIHVPGFRESLQIELLSQIAENTKKRTYTTRSPKRASKRNPKR